MKLKKSVLAIFIALILLPGIVKSAEFSGKPNAAKECSICHYEWMPEFLYDAKGTGLVPFQKEKVVADEKMCFSCHNGTVGDSRIKIWTGDVHKLTDEIPKHIKIPEDLPLENGKIACRTCHTAHATKKPEEETVATSIFLRTDNKNSELCRKCHTDHADKNDHPFKEVKKGDIKDELVHLDGKLGENSTVICQSCHTPHSPKEKKLLIYYLQDSRLCTICHDDKVDDKFEYIKGVLNHPINIKHDRDEEVKAVTKLKGTYGKDNEVICLTCHKVHNAKGDKLTIVENRNDKLCLTCHSQKDTIKSSPHDMTKVKGFVNNKKKSAKEAGVCGSCHDPHGWALNLPNIEADLITKACLSCHAINSYAPKKVIDYEKFNHPVNKEVKEGMDDDESLPLFGEILKYFTEVFEKGEKKRVVTCATCHDSHNKAKDFLRKETVDGTLCITCHKDKEMINKTVHGKEKLEQTCLSCHKIHNSDNKRLLLQAKDDGCMDCHKKDGIASKSLIGEHSHPKDIQAQMKIDKPFKLTDGLFTCVSCHDPHKQSKVEGGIEKDFIRGEFVRYDDFCIACHSEQKVVISTDHDLRDKAQKKKNSVCYQCHSPHNALTDKYIMNVEYTYKKLDDICLNCHREGGLGEKKIAKDGHKLGKVEDVEKYKKFLTKVDGEYQLVCITCHSAHINGPKKGEEGDFRYSFLMVRASDNETITEENICQVCHSDKEEFAESKHNIFTLKKTNETVEKLKVANDTCGFCHKAHDSGYFMIDKKYGEDIKAFCSDCHKKGEIAEETAIFTSHKMDVKPEQKVDFKLYDNKIVCFTCHDSHKKSKGMLADTKEKNICYECHREQTEVEKTNHNMTTIDYIDVEMKNIANENICYVCHKPHNFPENVNFMWRFDKQVAKPFAFDLCINCHSQKGVGYKKIPEAYDHDRIFKIFPYREQFKQYLFDDTGKSSSAGSITCQTCHDPHLLHKDNEAVATEGKDKPKNFVLNKVMDDFCAVCHGDESKALFEKYHDKKFRETRVEKLTEKELLQRLFEIRDRLERMKKDEK